MKNKSLIFGCLCTIMLFGGCFSLYEQPKQEVLKTASYESGNKTDGIVYLAFTYNCRTEHPRVNIEASLNNAKKICGIWGYKNAEFQDVDEVEARCVKFNMNNGNCLVRKVILIAVCE